MYEFCNVVFTVSEGHPTALAVPSSSSEGSISNSSSMGVESCNYYFCIKLGGAILQL